MKKHKTAKKQLGLDNSSRRGKIHTDSFRYQGKIWLHGHVFICIMLTSFNIAESNKISPTR